MDISKTDLMHLLETARLFNRLCIKYNAEYIKQREIMETTKDNDEATEAINRANELQNKIKIIQWQFSYLDFIENLPQDDYLLVINYLYNDYKTQDDLMADAGITTRQGLYKRIRNAVYKAFVYMYE